MTGKLQKNCTPCSLGFTENKYVIQNDVTSFNSIASSLGFTENKCIIQNDVTSFKPIIKTIMKFLKIL